MFAVWYVDRSVSRQRSSWGSYADRAFIRCPEVRHTSSRGRGSRPTRADGWQLRVGRAFGRDRRLGPRIRPLDLSFALSAILVVLGRFGGECDGSSAGEDDHQNCGASLLCGTAQLHVSWASPYLRTDYFVVAEGSFLSSAAGDSPSTSRRMSGAFCRELFCGRFFWNLPT